MNGLSWTGPVTTLMFQSLLHEFRFHVQSVKIRNNPELDALEFHPLTKICRLNLARCSDCQREEHDHIFD